MDQNARTYLRNFGLAMAAYVVLVTGSTWLLRMGVEGAWQYLLAILPVTPLLFALRAYLRYLGQLDELQQRIQLQAIAFAAGATGMLTLTYGFLENAGLPQLSMIWVFPLLMVLWGAASIFLTQRYQ